MEDRVTLGQPVSESASADYGRRCEAIGRERRNTADLQDAMDHPGFKQRHHELLDVLATEQRQRKPFTEHPQLLTVRVGTLKTVEAMRQALLNANYRIGDWACDLMKQPAFAAGIVQKEKDVDFVIASNAELGYPNGCTVAQTYKAARQRGWSTCEPADAIYLRLALLDQPEGEWILVAMEPITASDGYLRVFYVGHAYDGCWLNGCRGYPDYFWSGGRRWAFRCK